MGFIAGNWWRPITIKNYFTFRRWSRALAKFSRPETLAEVQQCAGAGIFPPLSNLRAVQVQSWRKAEYFGMKCVGSRRVNTIPSTSSIPAENLFWERCFRRYQAQQKEISRSWKETGMWHISHGMRYCSQGKVLKWFDVLNIAVVILFGCWTGLILLV